MSDRLFHAGEPPLAYTVRASARAKRVTLRVLPGVGLVVSVPKRFARRDVPAVVEAHREWAESALAELARRTPDVCRTWPPETLVLAGIGRRIALRWRDPGREARPRWPDAGTLELAVSPEDRVAVASSVAAALKAEGRRTLPPRLAELAERHAFRYSRVAIRGQRSVWGSCSSRGTVSLNYKLLFLRPALLDYVLLHELAHTRHLDHSVAFWRLLEHVEPNARALDRELRSAGERVPPWLELARGRGVPAG